jgi:hypothetical protein
MADVYADHKDEDNFLYITYRSVTHCTFLTRCHTVDSRISVCAMQLRVITVCSTFVS